ncbi:MAG: E2/UBC family protein [Candidatus Omnitrophota bacterium]
MEERIAEEACLLKAKYPNLQFGQNYAWIMIPDFNLPEGYNCKTTRLLFLISSSYPHASPDNFYVDAGLKFANNNPLASYSEGAQVPIQGSWGCFSWHPEIWQPSAEIQKGDNLLTFMKSVNLRLRELN